MKSIAAFLVVALIWSAGLFAFAERVQHSTPRPDPAPADGIVVLTGANDDAAHGASCIRAQGGLIIVQDPASAESPQMPSAAISRANPQVVAHLTQIAALIRQATQVAP